MNDLNRTFDNGDHTGWDEVGFWLDSVNYWTNRLNQVDGDFDASVPSCFNKDSYQHSIDQAWRMVDIYLLP
jgi:hypothetical protein|tara:strand:+ start:171 stop:383 length:213 start_codon:yes stop_codon:yes gene_type:complete